ncbi:MAG: DUF5711 family protein [Angelakisella sp.]
MGAATEFDKLRKRRRLRRAFKRTTWLMILAVLAAVGFLLWSVGYYLDFGSRARNYLSSIRSGPGYPVSLDDMDVHELIPMGTDIAVVTRSGNYIYNKNGARLYTCLNHYSNPVTRGGGGKLITYDSGGQEVKISTKTALLYTLHREGKVFAADICGTGAFAIAESCKGSLGLVTAYSANNEEMYRWETSQGYLYQLSLNSRGTMFAAATVNSQGGKLSSRLHFHHFSASEQAGSVELPDELVLSMVWVEQEQRLQVITDKRLHVYDSYASELFVADIPEGMTDFENSPDGVIYLASGDSRSPQGVTVTGYDGTLRQLGSWQLHRKLFSMQYYDNRLLLLAEGKLYLSDRTLGQVKERETDEVLTLACGIGNQLYGVTGQGLTCTVL